MPNNLLLAKAMKGKTIARGRLMSTNSSEARVAVATTRLINNGVLPQASKNNTSPDSDSMDLLFSLNMTIDETTNRNYSLIGTETSAEVIQNPNILDQTLWDEMTNESIVATDKFPNATDNFFTIDAPLDDAEKRRRTQLEEKKAARNMRGIAADLIMLQF